MTKLSYHISVFLILTSNLLIAQSSELKSFRGFEWGTQIDTVRKLEIANPLQSSSFLKSSTLTYKQELLKEEVQIDYIFENDKLINGSYEIDASDSFKELFIKFRDYLIAKYKKPNSWAVAQINSKELWIKENDVGLFRGPELYWYFQSGFIALLASRFEEEVTIKILYVGNKTIEEYAADLALPIDRFYVEFPE